MPQKACQNLHENKHDAKLQNTILYTKLRVKTGPQRPGLLELRNQKSAIPKLEATTSTIPSLGRSYVSLWIWLVLAVFVRLLLGWLCLGLATSGCLTLAS